jgi:hypothetical protein
VCVCVCVHTGVCVHRYACMNTCVCAHVHSCRTVEQPHIHTQLLFVQAVHVKLQK